MSVALRNCPYVERAAVDSPVGLVVVRSGQARNAATVSFFSEVAHHPTSLWISIARDSYTRSLIEQTREFTFVTLHYDQAGIAEACGTRSGRDTDKCAGLDLYEKGGFLFLRGAIASTACKVVQSVPLDDHVLYIAHILHGEIEGGRGVVRNLLVSDLKKR